MFFSDFICTFASGNLHLDKAVRQVRCFCFRFALPWPYCLRFFHFLLICNTKISGKRHAEQRFFVGQELMIKINQQCCRINI